MSRCHFGTCSFLFQKWQSLQCKLPENLELTYKKYGDKITQKRGRVVPCPDFWLPAAKNRIPVAGFPVLLHNGASLLIFFPSLPIVEASLLVDIAFLLSREPLFLAGQYYFQQDVNNSNRTPKSPAGRVSFQQDNKKFRLKFGKQRNYERAKCQNELYFIFYHFNIELSLA